MNMNPVLLVACSLKELRFVHSCATVNPSTDFCVYELKHNLTFSKEIIATPPQLHYNSIEG